MMLLYGNIAEISADVIVNAANGKGWMGGILGRLFNLNGVAESLHYATKGKIEREAMSFAKKNRVKPGDVFVTSPGNLNARFIYHAVTMAKPRMTSSLDAVRSCLENILIEGRRHKVKTIAIPFLGTGTGKLPIDEVAALYREVFGPVTDMEIILMRPRKTQREFYFFKG